MTSEQLELVSYPERTSGLSDSHAKTSALPESKKDLPANVVLSFLQLQGLLETSKKKIDPASYSLRTLKTYLALMGDGTFSSFKLSWTKSGTTSNGTFSTQPRSCLSTGSVSILSDILEDEVPDTFFLSETAMKNLLASPNKSLTPLQQDTGKHKEADRTLLKVGRRVKQVGNISNSESFGGNPQIGRVYDPTGLAPALNTMQGGGREPKILIKEATRKGYAEGYEGDSVNLSQPNSKTRRGRVGKQIANTLETGLNQGVIIKVKAAYHLVIDGVEYALRIRKLTPLECWRLQGFTDEQFRKAEQVNSNSQLYKQAGNSVSVPVVYEVAKRLKISSYSSNMNK